MAMATAIMNTRPIRGRGSLTQKFLDVKSGREHQAALRGLRKNLSDDVRPSIKGVQLVLDEIGKKSPKARAMKPEQIVDTTTLDPWSATGFFKKLSVNSDGGRHAPPSSSCRRLPRSS